MTEPQPQTRQEQTDFISGKMVFLTQIGVACMTIIAYVALTITNHDATPLLTLLAGQGIGGVIQSKSPST